MDGSPRWIGVPQPIGQRATARVEYGQGFLYTPRQAHKFELLKRLGFEVTPEQVWDTLLRPDKVIPQSGGRFIAQKGITERHILRVVYREEKQTRVVITFYPGRKERYEV